MHTTGSRLGTYCVTYTVCQRDVQVHSLHMERVGKPRLLLFLVLVLVLVFLPFAFAFTFRRCETATAPVVFVLFCFFGF